MAGLYDSLTQLQRYQHRSFQQMLESIDRFEQAEMLFNWRSDYFRKKYDIPDGEVLSVEALRDRANDEQWQNAVVDCRYYRHRADTYSNVYDRVSQRIEQLQAERRQ